MSIFISKKWIRTVVKSWLIVGSLDIVLAFVNAWWSSGVSPERVLRYITSGLIGKTAFQGSQSVMWLGLGIHFLIAFFWTLLFFLLYPKFRKVVRQIIWQAVLYGLFIWLIMNMVILPVTSVPAMEFQWLSVIKGLIILMIAIGLPLAIGAKTYYHNRYLVHRRKKHAEYK